MRRGSSNLPFCANPGITMVFVPLPGWERAACNAAGYYASVAQLVEHSPFKRGVVGSSPIRRTNMVPSSNWLGRRPLKPVMLSSSLAGITNMARIASGCATLFRKQAGFFEPCGFDAHPCRHKTSVTCFSVCPVFCAVTVDEIV